MVLRNRELWMLEKPDEEVEQDYFRLFRVGLAKIEETYGNMFINLIRLGEISNDLLNRIYEAFNVKFGFEQFNDK